MIENIQTKIYEVRDCKVMFDFDLAPLFKVSNKALRMKVRKSKRKIAADFIFELTQREWESVFTSSDRIDQSVKFGVKMPFAFTQQGVSELAVILCKTTAES